MQSIHRLPVRKPELKHNFWWGECVLQQFERRALVNAAAGEDSKIIDSALFSMAWAWDPMHVLPTLIKKNVRSDEYSC